MLSFNALRASGLRSWWLGLLLACACSSDPPGVSCGVVGRERSCPCSGNAVGIQACQLDGQWESCTCYPRASNGGSSGVAANGGSGGASANAGASAGRGGSTGQRSSADRAQGGGSPNPWNPWDGFPGFAGFPWSR
jgi:hypothetical protein